MTSSQRLLFSSLFPHACAIRALQGNAVGDYANPPFPLPPGNRPKLSACSVPAKKSHLWLVRPPLPNASTPALPLPAQQKECLIQPAYSSHGQEQELSDLPLRRGQAALACRRRGGGACAPGGSRVEGEEGRVQRLPKARIADLCTGVGRDAGPGTKSNKSMEVSGR